MSQTNVMMDFFVSHMHLKILLAKIRFCIYILMNPPTVRKYKSYTSPNSSSKSSPKPSPNPKRKGSRKSSKSSRRTAAAQKIQRLFRMKRSKERPHTTRPSRKEMMDSIFSKKDLRDLRRSQARRATGHRGSSRTQYHLGATGSW